MITTTKLVSALPPHIVPVCVCVCVCVCACVRGQVCTWWKHLRSTLSRFSAFIMLFF